MKLRDDGSVQSANTPTFVNTGFKEDYCLYRCMVTKVFYVDDPNNFTKNAQNPEVIYQVVILGGWKAGQFLSNVRMASDLGGDNSYYERTLKPTSKNLTQVKLQDHDGDIVYVQFVQAHQGFPIIIALGTGINDISSGSKKSDAPRSKRLFNGVTEEINNKGEYSVSRAGGTLSTKDQTFNAKKTGFESKLSLKKNQSTLETPNSKLDLTSGKVALGANGVELLHKISEQLQVLINFLNNIDSQHKHLGNLGYPTDIPIETADFTSAASSLSTIKSAIDGIKGSL